MRKLQLPVASREGYKRWLFVFKDPKNPKRPKQLMILWSSKNEKEIECNGVKFRMKNPLRGNKLNGAVASWYYDGEKMHENFMLEQCDLIFTKNSISSKSSKPSRFVMKGNCGEISVGDEFKFKVKMNSCYKPIMDTITISDRRKYTVVDAFRFETKCKVCGEPMEGSDFFECMFCSTPIPSWYWGLFHFDDGSVLNYFEPYLFSMPIRKNISFFDCNGTHTFDNMRIKSDGKKLPSFTLSGSNKNDEISFRVKTYSRATWKFKKKHEGIKGIIPNRLTYNEYPAIITKFSLKSKGKTRTLSELGKSVGNAEHTEGFLF